MSLYLAVIADVIESRKISGMPQLSARLDKVNHTFKDELIAPFKYLRGDEIEAVLSPKTDFVKVLRALKYHLLPLKIRIGLGIGNIELDGAPPYDPFLLNGTAFFAARDAIDTIKHAFKEQESVCLHTKADTHYLNTWNMMWRFYCGIVNKWNDAQWDAVMTYEECRSLADAAGELGRKYQSIQRSVERAKWDLVSDCEAWMKKEMALLLNRIQGNTD